MAHKFSVLFMADDGKTVRWRAGFNLVRFLFLFMIVLPVLAGGSLWLNWHLYREGQALRARNDALQHEVEESARTAARLSNLAQYLRHNDPEMLGQLVVARLADTQAADARPNPAGAAVAALNGETGSGEAAASPAANGGTGSGESRTEGDPAEPGDRAEADTDGASPALPDENYVPDEDDVLDKGFARVENLVARRVGARSLRISFDLYNTEQVPQLAGRVIFELVLTDGSTHALGSNGDTTYRINRLKKIIGNPVLPAGITDTEGAFIRIHIFADNEVIYRTLTPLQS
jgi:hypothetical protein